MTKIIKHAREGSAHGLLLGLDLDGVLEVSNSFPLPPHSGEDDEKSARSSGKLCTSYIAIIFIIFFFLQHAIKAQCSVL